jgi:hypothetical protein
MPDRTSRIETAVNSENKPKLIHLLRLWKFVFTSAKTMSLIFLCLMTALSLLRPVADATSQDRLRDVILRAYVAFEDSQAPSARDGCGRGSVDVDQAALAF